MIKILISFAFTFCTLAMSFAEPKGQLEIRFLAERLPNNLGKVVLSTAEASSDPFDLPMNNLSPPQKPPARSFSVQSTKKNISLATVTLPEEGNSFVVLLLPTAEGFYSPLIMPFDNPAFKAGDYYFHNNANKTVLGSIGTTKFILNPNQGVVLHPKGAHDEKFYDVALGVKEAEGNRVLSTTRWPDNKVSRFYVFFYVDPKTKRITFRGVDEFVIPDKD